MYCSTFVCNLFLAAFLIIGFDRCNVEASAATGLPDEKGGNFSCLGRSDGYHPDPDLGCGYFQGCFFNTTHVTRITFICPSGYRYQEKLQVCELDESCNPSPDGFPEDTYKKKRISINKPFDEVVKGNLHRSKRQANILPAYLSPAREDAVGIILPMASDGRNTASTRIPSYLLDYASGRPNQQMDLRPIVIVEAAEPAPSARRSSGGYSDSGTARSTVGRNAQSSAQRLSTLDQDQGYSLYPRQVMQIQDPQSPYGEIILVAPQQFGTRSLPQYIYREAPAFTPQRGPQQMFGGVIAFSRGSQRPQPFARYQDVADPIKINRIPEVRQQDALPREPPVIFYPSQPVLPMRPSPPEVSMNVQPPVRQREYNLRPDPESEENDRNEESKESSEDSEPSGEEERYPTPDSPASGFRPSIGANFERYPQVPQFHPPRSRKPPQEIRQQIDYPPNRIRRPVENVRPAHYPQDLRYSPLPRNVEQERPRYQEFSRHQNYPRPQQNPRPLSQPPSRHPYLSLGDLEEAAPQYPPDNAPQSEVSYLPGVEINDDEIPSAYNDEDTLPPERNSQISYHRPINGQIVEPTESPNIKPVDEKEISPAENSKDDDEITTSKPTPRYPAPYYHRVHFNPPPRRPLPFVTSSTPTPFRSQYNIVSQVRDTNLEIPPHSFIRNRPSTRYENSEEEPGDVEETSGRQKGEGGETTTAPFPTTKSADIVPEEPRTTTERVYLNSQVVKQRTRLPIIRQRPLSRNRYGAGRKMDDVTTTEAPQVLEGTPAIEAEEESTTIEVDKNIDYKPASIVEDDPQPDSAPSKLPNLFGSRLKHGGTRTRSLQFGRPRSRSVDTRMLPNLSKMRHVEAAASSLDEERFSPTRQLSQRHRTRPRLFTFDDKDAMPSNSSPKIAPSA